MPRRQEKNVSGGEFVMENHSITVPTHAWFGDKTLELKFPEGWEVNECRMEGHGSKAMGPDEIRQAIENPIGTPPLSEIAKGKEKVIILFDDFSRPTRAADIIPSVLDSLFSAGIEPDQIRFVSALGTHRAMTRNELAGKLGEDIVLNYPVYNHNAWACLVDMGKSSSGTPILVNREYASCDLRIGIGCIIPHVDAGFSGGLKIVLPGVMGMETINYNHMKVTPRNPDGSMSEFTFGKVYDNKLRDDAHEIVQKVGLDFKIDVIVNENRETTKIFAGDGLESFYEGVKYGKKFYVTQPFLGADITVSNTFPIEDEAGKGLWPCYLSTREGGDAVMLCHSVDGQLHHFGNMRFGTDYGGEQCMMARKLPHSAYDRTLIVNPYHLKMDTEYFCPMDKATIFKKWEEAVAELQKDYGAGTKVAVYPYASIQCPQFPEDY
jgi:nickel-dependent lactate racemase